MMMIIYYRGSKMIDLQSADSGLDKLWPNIDAVLNALLAFQITTLCPMLLLFFVGFYFLYVLNQLYIRMFGVKNSHLSPAWLKNPLLAEISQTSHSGHFLRIPFEKWPPHTVPPWKSLHRVFLPNFFFKSHFMCGEVRNKFWGQKSTQKF